MSQSVFLLKQGFQRRPEDGLSRSAMGSMCRLPVHPKSECALFPRHGLPLPPGAGGGGHGQWWKLHGRAVTQGKAHCSSFRMTPKQGSLGHGTRKGHGEEGTEKLSFNW